MKMDFKTPLANDMPHQMQYQLRLRFEKKNNDSMQAHYKNYSKYNHQDCGLNNFLLMLSAEDRDNFQKLNESQVEYGDLSALTEEDLKLAGFMKPDERSQMLESFVEFPFQRATLTDIYQDPDSLKYNDTITANATTHLKNMQSFLEVSQTTAMLYPPEDDLLGDKYYSSRYTVEALKELCKLAADVDDELDELKEPTPKAKPQHRSPVLITLSVLTAVLLAGIFMWKFK